jgi:hypothetical protein
MTSPSKGGGEEAELAARLLATDAPPADAGGAVAALTPDVSAESLESPPAAPEAPRRGPGRPRKSETAAKSPKAPSAPPAPSRRGRLSRAELEQQLESLESQLALARPDEQARAQAELALEATFAIVGALMAEQIHPTLDISDKAKQLAAVWAVPLAPHMDSLAEQMPYVAAAGATVAILLPNYKAYRAAVLSSSEVSAEVIPGPVAEGLGVTGTVHFRPRGAE